MSICNWKQLPVFFVGSLFALVSIVGQADETFGTAMCKRTAPGESCSTAWDFTATPRTSYWVERFVYESSAVEWQNVAGPFAGHEGSTDELVEGGFLYRVVGCNDKSKSIDCIGSTVFWAPQRPKNLDDIPDIVNTPEGYYLRDKEHSAEEQILDYNIALIRKLVTTVDMKSMPPMTELPFRDPRDLWGEDAIILEDATLSYNVYILYHPINQSR